MLSLYNVLFSSLPPMVIGLADQLVPGRFLLAHPSIYGNCSDRRFSKQPWEEDFLVMNLYNLLCYIPDSSIQLPFGWPL